MAHHKIQFRALKMALVKKAQEEGLSQRQIATAIGTSDSTVCRFFGPGEHVIDADLVARACAWLGVPVSTFSENGGIPADLPTPEIIDLALYFDPKLTEEQARKLSDMMRAAYAAVARKETDVK